MTRPDGTSRDRTAIYAALISSAGLVLAGVFGLAAALLGVFAAILTR